MSNLCPMHIIFSTVLLRVRVRVCVCECACVFIWMHGCECIPVCVCIGVRRRGLQGLVPPCFEQYMCVCIRVCIHVHMYVTVCVCMHVVLCGPASLLFYRPRSSSVLMIVARLYRQNKGALWERLLNLL